MRKGVFSKFFKPILSFIGLPTTLFIKQTNLQSNSKNTEILWDNYGVPHIYGADTKGAFQAFGWAQMHSHGNLILRLYGQARGRAAEYWGEDYLELDKWVVTMDIPQRAKIWYKRQNATFRGYLDAFATGINNYAKEHPELIDNELKVVLPVTGEDVLTHLHRTLNFNFIVDPRTVAANLDNKSEQPEPSKGSNGWAIAPKRSKSGNAMLLANPHLPWSDLHLWYEAQITAPAIDAYGASLVGIPVLSIAFNNNLGWTHTVNAFDGWDLYELTLSGQGYLFDGRVRHFKQQTTELKVKQEDGTMRSQELTVQNSIHGPVVKQEDGKAFALRVVGLDRPRVLGEQRGKVGWRSLFEENHSKKKVFSTKVLELELLVVCQLLIDG